MNDLNELLKKRAEEKLEKDIEDYLQLIREHKLFRGINDKTIRLEDEASETIHFFFWRSSTAFRFIKSKFLDEYIAKEAKKFMEKVDTLQQDIDELKDQNI